ncbi:MAG TPA: 2-succinyl-5-enolpyruvyl-6-hydroxy-3-cyclohexene-1-carboxylic-acid synthase [Candidatus Binataceae bacterium]|nr:2-succinyl-5-enolpyruvyl-6-hydroxy-3-cyclohexene-1-carboxylic-acid synthase [Candidatus Binataceae bacterium]
MAQEFARAGVTDACISPGSRSTAIVTGLLRSRSIQPWVILDERSAGFFAMGMAREKRRPVLLVCTSGTAAANYLPAVVEASLSNIPLIVVTADRPREARDFRSAQTIDQVRLYGSHARWSVDLATPHAGDALDSYYRTVASRAVATAMRAPAGPVHLNFPMREPLIDVEEEAAALRDSPRSVQPDLNAPRARVYPVRSVLSDESVGAIAEKLRGLERGAIVCGPRAAGRAEDARAVARLAERLSWPILADPLSGLRVGAHDGSRVVDSYDVLLRDPAFCEAHQLDAIFQIGDPPVSKPLAQFMAASRRFHLMVAEPGTWPDPLHVATDVAAVTAAEFCDALAAALGGSARASSWLDAWLGASAKVRAALDEALAAETSMFEPKVITETIRLIPDGALVHAGNSMPVRDMDTFVGRAPRDLVLEGNRGASGIDGVLSTALGAAAARMDPTVLILGDLSCLHDIGGLQIAARYPIHLLVIVINNDGGGIFSFLPQAGLGDPFETFFGTPHGLGFEKASALGRARYAQASSWAGFEAVVSSALREPGLHLLEIRSERNRNFKTHRRVIEAALDRLRGEAAIKGAR